MEESHKLALQIGNDESLQPNKSLYLLTDSARHAWEQSASSDLAETGRQLGRMFRITHFSLAKTGQWNQAITDLKPSSNLVRSQFESTFLTRAQGFGGGNEPQ